MPHKIIINRCFGGFGLSEAAKVILRGIGVLNYEEHCGNKTTGLYDEWNIPRHHPDLVRVVELLGEKESSAKYAKLVVYTLCGDRYQITDYDGKESVVEPDFLEDDFITC